jgi:glycosyltransferase involved in cell wall biosynthesis
MTILVSSHFVYSGRVGGAEHMTYNLVRGLKQARADPVLLCSDAHNLARQFVLECGNTGVPVITCGGSSGPRFVLEQRACLDRSLSADAILFPNYFLPPIVPRRLGAAAVVIHDFQYRHFPEHFSLKKRAWLLLSHVRALRQADQVIFISEFVKQDAVRWFGSVAERGVVIPNPISWDRFSENSGAHPVPNRPYILSVAAHYPHKGLDVLLKAFARFSVRRKDFRLVLVGQLANNLVSVSDKQGRLSAAIRELGLQDRVCITGYLSDSQLGNYYRNASAFAFPSVFEGFGMPAVEALGFGLRCLTTRCAALPEATLGLADYVDNPADPDEWAIRLDHLVDAPRLPLQHIQQIKSRYDPCTIGVKYKSILLNNQEKCEGNVSTSSPNTVRPVEKSALSADLQRRKALKSSTCGDQANWSTGVAVSSR